MSDVEADSAVLRAAPEDSEDWSDEVWGAWSRAADRAQAAKPTVSALQDRIAELEEYERLSVQQCQKGAHVDWLVDSEYAHACPWCRIAELESVLAERDEQIAYLIAAEPTVDDDQPGVPR